MVNEIDLRPLLPTISVPTLVVHRRDDRIVPIGRARELAAGIPGARLAEVDGVDHFPQVGDVWVKAVEELTTGTLGRARWRPSSRAERPVITTMGGFDVVVDGERVPVSAWGSRRARQLCQRIAVAIGAPVTRDELAEMLWPDEAC